MPMTLPLIEIFLRHFWDSWKSAELTCKTLIRLQRGMQPARPVLWYVVQRLWRLSHLLVHVYAYRAERRVHDHVHSKVGCVFLQDKIYTLSISMIYPVCTPFRIREKSVKVCSSPLTWLTLAWRAGQTLPPRARVKVWPARLDWQMTELPPTTDWYQFIES